MIRSAHLICVAGLLSIVACEAVSFRSSKKTDPQAARNSADVSADDDDCLAIRSGRMLSQSEQQRFGSVGMIAILGPDLTTAGLCSAALIRPNVVLTAQHCVSDIPTLTPIPNRQLVFTLESSPALNSNLTTPNPLRRKVANVIRWEEITTPASPFRDVALMVLDAPFDESVPLYDVKQLELLQREAVTMVGFGGYTNGADAKTYSVGTKRIGAGLVVAYGNERMAGFPVNETRFNAVSDYLLLDPGTGGEIICGGDSGSSLFIEKRGFRTVVGVTSMGISANGDEGEQCASTVQGLFVPSHRIRNWINSKLKTIAGEKELLTYSLLGAKIVAVNYTANGAGIASVRLKVDEYFDNGLTLAAGFEFTAKTCNEDCPHPTVRQGILAVNESVVAKVYKIGEEFFLHSIAFDAVAPVSQFTFTGMIEGFEPEVTTYGRKQRPVRFSQAQPASANDKLTYTGERMQGQLCTAGCSKATTVGPGVNLVEGQQVKVTAEFIEGSGVYLRNVEYVAPVVSSGNASPAPLPADEEDDDEEDDDSPRKRKKRSGESPCAEE